MASIPFSGTSGSGTRKRWAAHVFAGPCPPPGDLDAASQGTHGAPSEDMASNAGSCKSSTGGRGHDTTLEAVRALWDLTNWDEDIQHVWKILAS